MICGVLHKEAVCIPQFISNRLRCEMDSSTLGVLHTVDMVVVVNCLNESGAFWKGGMMFV